MTSVTDDCLSETKEILAGCLFVPVEKIGDDDRLASIREMDSLSFSSIALEIEARIGRPLDAEEILSLRGVRDIAELLSRHR